MNQTRDLLSGLRIVDLTRVLAGPFCTMMLADMGANVIKIERPGKGDDTRHFAPFQNGESAYYMNLNRGKQGITLDLKGRGKEIFLDLVRTADVVVENFRPGTMDKLGLGYDTLKEINPKLVYAAVSGFGDSGPYRLRSGYDIIGQAMGGLMSTTGWPGGEPTRSGTAMADVLAGLSVTIGILSALRHRDQTGVGQKVDVALVDSVVASLEIITQIYLADGRIPERAGKTRLTGCHIKLSATPARLRSPAPQLGEHSAAVFGDLLGLTADQRAELQLDGVI
jgi:crotonobetainyl-CoA:carnitine CoA-transferase CaiB-like acyl-CoA transferase